MNPEDQTEEAFSENYDFAPEGDTKGMDYATLLVDNIIGIDNGYESFGESLGKKINEDELGFLKETAVGAYEGAKEFVTSPIDTTSQMISDITDSVSRLGTESLDGRLKSMFNVGYQEATDEQVNKAREAVIGDAVMVSGFIPAAKGVTSVAKAAIPGKVKADVVGQMRSLVDGDKEFRTESTKPAQGLSAQAVGATYKPKMFSSGEVAVTPSNYSVADFYSPTVETLRNTEFPSKGYKGSELLKLLRDKTPGVRKAELDTMNLGIEDQKRYTKEDVLDLAQRRSYKVTAEVQDADPNQDIQRQIIRDKEVDYATIKVNAIPATDEIASFFPVRGYTHYDPETIAHTRLSVREDSNGAEYVLVEELQSDLLQQGAAKPRGPISTDDAYEEVLDVLAEDISKEPDFKGLYENNQKYFDNLFKVGAENSRQYSLRERRIPVSQEELDRYNTLVEETRGMADNLGDVPYEKGFQRLSTFLENAGYEEGYRIERRTKAVGPSPLTENSDAVRLTLQAALAKAADSDVTSLVVPNVQRIIAADRARPGSKEYQDYMKPNSGFQRTYVKGVEKFIKQLQDEYGDAIKIEQVELPYVKEKLYYQGEELDVPKTAIKIDFSNLKDVNFRVGRFAEGGIVEDKEMNRLFQEGGIADDGMSREPVTGNEIPPGSMASEVRDDIPTQLSEGEYVVPADVLRYYGVRFFEDLRAQAKQGMMEMEADGRIGGVPANAQGVPSGGQEDALTPEEEQMLMEALGSDTGGMAMGGYVDQQPLSTPYQDQATMYQAPVTNGMARGGQAFDRTQFSSGSTGSGIEAKKYINPKTGETRTFNFIGTTALGIIPEDFVPWTQSLADQAAENTKDTSVTEQVTGQKGGEGKDRDRGLTGTNESGLSKSQQEAMAADPFSFGMDALGGIKSNGMLDKLSMAPGLVGIAASLANKAVDANAIAKAEAAIASMPPTDPNYSKLADALTAAGGKVPTPSAASTAPTAPTATSAPTGPAPASTPTSGGRDAEGKPSGTTTGGLSYGGAKGSGDVSGTISTSGSTTPSSGLSFGSTGSVSATSANSKDYSMGTPAGSPSNSGGYGNQGSADEGRRAKGGLISKPTKKTARKTKGFAGK